MTQAAELERLTEKYNIAASYSSHMSDYRKSPGLTDLVDRATRGGNHIFFGEPHLDGMMVKQYELMANNPDMFKAASKNGVKHLALEIPSGMQLYVDNYVSGKTSRADFLENMKDLQTVWASGDANQAFRENFVKTVENAYRAGMKVHLADVKANADIANLYPQSIKDMESALTGRYGKEKPNMTLNEFFEQEMAMLPETTRTQLHADIQQHQEKWRMSRFDDTEQYLYLRERIPPHESIMGVVGLTHLNNGMDKAAGHKIMGIDDHLEAEGKKVTTIEVHTHKSKGVMADLAQVPGREAEDLPDYVVDLDNRTIADKQGQEIAKLDKAPEQFFAERRTPSANAHLTATY